MADEAIRLTGSLADRYRIDHEIGAGGMATVYLARDLKHNRSVALKVLRPELGAILGTERFLAEINVTANLQHPHLLPLFDSGEADGLLFYVMPYIEGESLRARLNRERQLPVDEALRIAVAVASALDYAHRHGVIHRDLKPENILLHEGQPLVADFGIALAVSNAGGARITQTGISLGTPQYMSPEQATSDDVIDGRSDIYSLGAVLYEMLAGEPPHTGKTTQAVLARMLTEKPRSVRVTRASVPIHVDAAIARALEKLPADRFAKAEEFAQALRERRDYIPSAMTPAMPRAINGRVPRWSIAAVTLVAGALVGAGVMRLTQPHADVASSAHTLMLRATIELPAEAPLALGSAIPGIGYNSPVVAMSPDGAWLAYVAQTATGQLLYLREMSTGEVRPLPGTEGAIHPFFSPDAQWIGFLTVNQVKKIPRQGGTVITLCEATTPVLAWWPQSHVIYFTEVETSSLSRVSADGGQPDRVLVRGDVGAIRSDSLTRRIGRFSDVLPDGESVLASSFRGIGGDYDDVVLINVRTRATKVLIRSGYAARYVSPGYLIFARAGSLMAVRFDATRGIINGDPITIAAGSAMESLFGMLHATSSVSGLLAYVPGADLSVGRIAWIDRRGAVEYLVAPERTYGVVDLAPDDSRVAVHVADVKDYIWIWDLSRREARRVVHPHPQGWPQWSADGRRLAAVSRPSTTMTRIPVLHDVEQGGGIGEGVPLQNAVGAVGSWSPRGDVVALDAWPAGVTFHGLAGSASARGFDGYFPAFSPDGRWVAYTSNQTGTNEIFLRSYPDGKVVGQLSIAGGIEPRWQPSGELFYRNGRRWFLTHVSTDPEPRWDPPRLVFDTEFIDTPGMSYDVSRDGQRLLVVKRAQPVTQSRIEIIANWFELLERRR